MSTPISICPIYMNNTIHIDKVDNKQTIYFYVFDNGRMFLHESSYTTKETMAEKISFVKKQGYGVPIFATIKDENDTQRVIVGIPKKVMNGKIAA